MPVQSHITLSELASRISNVITQSFKQQSYWVVADVLDHKFYEQKNMHWFSLAEKDPVKHSLKAKLQAVAWSDRGTVAIESFERITGQRFKSDINVLVNVLVIYHPTYGIQLVLNDIDTTYTLGVLEQQRRQTLEDLVKKCPGFIRLEGERYVTRNNELLYPKVIQKVALLTSSTAAGYVDFQHTIDSNEFGYRIRVDNYFVTVQGEANADAIVQKFIEIYDASQNGNDYDVVVLIRGGGGQADFLIFEQFALARAVAKFPIPIIAGIGHQINETIVDLMSRTSVKTPSAAAHLIIQHNKSFEEDILQSQKRIVIRSQQLLSARLSLINQLNLAVINNATRMVQVAKDNITRQSQIVINNSRSLLFTRRVSLNDACSNLLSRPRIIIGAKTIELTHVLENLKIHTRKYLVNKRGYLAHDEAMCRAFDPVNVLRRGFALIIHDGKITTNADMIKTSDQIRIRLSESELTATVQTKIKVNGNKLDV